MPELDRGDVSMSYSDEGDGPTVVLLHGHTLDRRVWLPVLGPLRDAGFRVVRPDLRGHGRSSRPDTGYHVSHHADDVVAVLDRAGVRRPTVVGFSFGGGVALELAVSHGSRVAALGLIAPVLPDRPFEPEFMDNLRQVARAIRADGVAAAMAGPWLASPLFSHSFTRPGVREATAAIVRDFPGAEFLATERDRVDRGWILPDRIGEITRPTRVMVGAREMAGFRGFADEIADRIATAELEVVPDAGHLLPLEAPDTVARMIIDLVRRA